MARATCPIVRQLLGATSSSVGLFRPAGADTPLAQWLHEHELGQRGGLGRNHQHHSRWSTDGVGVTSHALTRLLVMSRSILSRLLVITGAHGPLGLPAYC